MNYRILSIYEVADLPLDLPRPTLRSIEFRSPGDGAVKIDLGIAEILKTLFENLRYWGLYRKRYQEETRRVELENKRS